MWINSTKRCKQSRQLNAYQCYQITTFKTCILRAFSSTCYGYLLLSNKYSIFWIPLVLIKGVYLFMNQKQSLLYHMKISETNRSGNLIFSSRICMKYVGPWYWWGCRLRFDPRLSEVRFLCPLLFIYFTIWPIPSLEIRLLSLKF